METHRHRPAPSTRSGFALTGRSRALNPRTNAVRPDIADVRLADQVFAPHYAAPVRRTLRADTTLREGRDAASPAMVQLRAGDPFDLLDVTGGVAWGIATGPGLVGYLDAGMVAA